MIKRIRLTPQKIKLVVHNTTDNHTNNLYRVYNLNNDVAVWFNTKEQIRNYFRTDTLFIDVNTSRVINFDTPTITIPNINLDNNKVVFETYNYGKYNETTGDYISQNGVNANLEDVLLLVNNNDLYNKIESTINNIRRIHISSTIPRLYKIRSAMTMQSQMIENFIGLSVASRNTRPYHVQDLTDVIMKDINDNLVYYDNRTNGVRHVDYNNRGSSIGVPTRDTDGVRIGRTIDEPILTTTPTDGRIRHDLLHSYHSGSRDIRPKNAVNDNSRRYFGIELETELRTMNDVAVYTTRLHDLMNANDVDFETIKFERDGSLNNGVEIITQPMSMAYILENKDKFKEMLELIDSMRATSHDNGRCGMHVHVSKTEISNDVHDNLWLIFECFHKELTIFSRRTNMNWCNFMCESLRRNHVNYIDKEYVRYNKPTSNDHHSAINNGNSNTTEFRIFRGTTNFQTFMANIQLVDNLVSIAREDNINGITWETIINYNVKYSELMEYNRRKNINSTKVLGTIVDIR